MADSKVFKLLDNLDAVVVGRGVEGFLRDKKNMVAEGAQTPEGYFIQAKEQDDGWKKIEQVWVRLYRYRCYSQTMYLQ